MNRKPIFDAVRTMFGRGFSGQEIAALDAAIDRAALAPDLAGPTPLFVGSAGLALIRKWEGCARRREDGCFESYPDPGTGGDPWTIGWGATGPGIVRGTVWTQEQCDARLEADLVRFAAQVAAAIRNAPTTQDQFDALVSFHYNTGPSARRRSPGSTTWAIMRGQRPNSGSGSTLAGGRLPGCANAAQRKRRSMPVA